MSPESTSIPDPVFRILDREFTWIHVRWDLYRQLFRTSSLRLELLSDIASTFFVHLERILRDDIILSLCRITHQAKSCGEDNATLKQLVVVLSNAGESALAKQLESRIPQIEQQVEPFRDHRNKRIAHSDLPLLLDGASVLEPITESMITRLLASIDDFMNAYNLHFGHGHTIYSAVSVPNHAASLMAKLKSAAVLEDKLREDPMKWFPLLEGHRFHDA